MRHEVKRLGRLASLVTEKAENADFKLALEHVEGWTGRLVSSAEVIQGGFEELGGEGVRFRSGDVLFGKLRPYLAKAWVADRVGAAVGDFHVYRPERDIHSRFLLYSLLRREYIDEVNASTYGSKMPRASWDYIKATTHHVPGLAEQRRIVEFLDRETAQIDELIAKQEQLISTLAERRERYLLSEVAPLAADATGSEWFGTVPTGWRSTRLKYVSSAASGGTPSTQVDAYWSETAEGTPWVAISDMSGTDAVHSTSKRLTADGLSQYAGSPGKPGTILFAMYASVGAVSRLAVAATWNQAILGLTPRRGVDRDYLFYVLKAIRPHLVHYFRSNTQDNMNAQQVGGLPLLMPSLEEQRRIAVRVGSQLDDYRVVSERASAVIAMLRERRQALISAAVTGQIDVGGASS